MKTGNDKQSVAERTAQIIEREDRASRWLGMKLQEVRAGYAKLAMRVTENMVNGQKVCHGGLIFSLADSSFGFACNTHNQHALAANCSIDFLAPAHLGDELTAEAQESAHAGRTRIYDVRVTNQDGDLIALFRGKSATVKGTWVE
jgi:acyl-CoA thioesterase